MERWMLWRTSGPRRWPFVPWGLGHFLGSDWKQLAFNTECLENQIERSRNIRRSATSGYSFHLEIDEKGLGHTPSGFSHSLPRGLTFFGWGRKYQTALLPHFFALRPSATTIYTYKMLFLSPLHNKRSSPHWEGMFGRLTKQAQTRDAEAGAHGEAMETWFVVVGNESKVTQGRPSYAISPTSVRLGTQWWGFIYLIIPDREEGQLACPCITGLRSSDPSATDRKCSQCTANSKRLTHSTLASLCFYAPTSYQVISYVFTKLWSNYYAKQSNVCIKGGMFLWKLKWMLSKDPNKNKFLKKIIQREKNKTPTATCWPVWFCERNHS